MALEGGEEGQWKRALKLQFYIFGFGFICGVFFVVFIKFRINTMNPSRATEPAVKY